MKKLKNLKIKSADIKRRVNGILNADLNEKKVYMSRGILKTALIAAVVTAVFTGTAFAISPVGREMIGYIISYFQSDKAVELTDVEELNKYSEEIGVSVSNMGYTLTLDNVAADDNFLHVFYTLTSDEQPFNENGITGKIRGKAADFWEECKINNEYVEDAANNNRYEGYFADEYTYKCANKYNVSKMDLPDKFNLEFFIAYLPGFEDRQDVKTAIEAGDKSNMLYLSTEIDKSKASSESITKAVNKPAGEFGTIEKIIFSPFGNQLILRSDKSDNLAVNLFAVCDDDGNYIDVLNDDFLGADENGMLTHSVEFAGDSDMTELTLIPLINNQIPIYDWDRYIDNPIGTYPIEYAVSDYGKVIVNGISINGSRVKVEFYTDGYVMQSPIMRLIDNKGNVIESDEIYRERNYKENTYVITFELSNTSMSDEEAIAGLRLFKQNITLDNSKAVTVDLK